MKVEKLMKEGFLLYLSLLAVEIKECKVMSLTRIE